MPDFAYIGRGLRLDEIEAYIDGYDFGPVPPDYVVLHHSAIPSATWARYQPNNAVWDAGEAGMTDAQIYAKRKIKVQNVRDYYEQVQGWDAGPHAFIDDRYVWLFTPMAMEGIHAKWGNAFHDASGRYHYSIGIEMIGWFDHVRWHPNQALLLGTFVAAIQRKLKTFTLDYMYADGVKPGMYTDAKGVQHCLHPERLRAHGIASHRDYNKPECPGAAITEAYYINVLRQAAGHPTAVVPIVQRLVVKHHLSDDPRDNYAQIRTDRRVSADEAMINGVSARLAPDTPIDVNDITNGWAHLSSGLGFVSMSCLALPGAAQ